MDELNRSKVAASQAPAVLAKYIEGKLKSGARPLILISDSHDRTAVAKKLKNSIGASIVQTGSLLAAADYGDQKISLAALTYVNEDYQLAKTAAEMRLLVQIYGYLRKEDRRKKFKNPLAVSIMFRDVLIEMENERGSEDIANSPDDDAYVEEFCFVRELWYAFIKPLRVDRRKRLENYAQELADSKSPVAYLHWGDEDKQIVEFLKSAQEKGAPVAIYEADFEVEKSKDKQLDCEDEVETEEGKAKLLDRLWRGEGINAKLEFKSALAYQAQTLEEAAEAAKRMLYSWLPPEPPDKALKIGILAYDRQLVRRLSSMLLQDDIHLQDTTGWPANNLLIGKALLALASTSGMEAKDLLRNTQNIAVRERLQSGWWQTPRYLASSSAKQEKWAKKWEDMKKLEKDLDDFICKSKGKRKISAWFDGLADQAEGEIYGSFFNQDDAAHSLRKLLRMLADEFKDVEEKEDDSDGDYRIDEVKRLLFDSLAATNLVPSNNESPIQLIRPGRFTTRKFDAVLLAGADSTQLPLATAPQLFNDKVRAMLGLPDIAKKIQKQRRALAWMLENTKQVGTVWHGEAGVSPYIELMLEHTKKAKETGKNDVKLEKLKRPWDKAVGNDALTGHKARLYHGIENTSVSSCVKLMECPYQYYASKVLRLREDRPQNIGERRERYGSFVHEILEKFHGQLIGKTKGSDGQAPAEASSASLREIIRLATAQSPPVWSKEKPEGFKEIPEMSLEERRYFSWEFGHYVERYVREIKDLYRSNGQIKAVEVDLGCKLPGSNVKLTAKADRIDEHEGKEDAIVDVKTGKPDKYEDSREYPQLPLYIKLYETKEKKKVSTEHTKFWTMYLKSGVIEMKKVGVENADEIADHMKGLLGKLEKASPAASVCLPANGVHKVCQYCSYGGLCRKKHWGR